MDQTDTVEPASWNRLFAEPIEFPKAKKLVALRDGALYVTKLPKSGHEAPTWQNSDGGIDVARLDVPLTMAGIGVMLTLNRHIPGRVRRTAAPYGAFPALIDLEREGRRLVRALIPQRATSPDLPTSR